MKSKIIAVLIALLAVACSSDDDDGSDVDRPSLDGERIYVANCAGCHASDGSGGVAPAIGDGVVNDKYSFEEMELLVTNGIGAMPGFGARLTAEEIEAVTYYVREELESIDEPGPQPTATPSDERTTRGVPPEIDEFASDWPLPNRDMNQTRSVFDSPIDSSNIADLEVAWTYEIVGGSSTFGAASTTPIILGDAIYFEDNAGQVHAVDRRTGEALWVRGPQGSFFGPTGVAVGWGKVFGTKAGSRGGGHFIVAYDRETGDELWATQIAFGGDQVNIQPGVHDGLVLASNSGFGGGNRGTINALDQENGAIIWQFDTIESPDLWGNPDINSGGGAWYPPAIDLATNTIYFGTGNPYPFPGTPEFPNASSRPGDNRWTSSTIALDSDSGALKWGHQPFPHDLFDRDQAHAVLGDVTIEGQSRRILLTSGKGAVIYGLDPTTGDPLWSTPVGVHQNDDVTELEGLLEVLPGSQGGVLTPTAFAEGVYYVATVNAPIDYEPDVTSVGFGVRLFQMPSQVIAIDASDGTILWDTEVAGDCFGGVTVVNDLVLTSVFPGKIYALDRATGEEVWSMDAPGGINGWPAVSGDTIIWPVGLASPPQLVALRLPEGPGE